MNIVPSHYENLLQTWIYIKVDDYMLFILENCVKTKLILWMLLIILTFVLGIKCS